MKNISNKFKVITGLSDHTLGTTIAVAATALGASVIEKHFTLDRSDKGPDCDFSIEPKELIKLCENTQKTWLSLGKEGFNRDMVESQNMGLRRSIYFVKNKKAGEIITKDDIRRIRPGNGLAPKFEKNLIGKILKKDVKIGDPTSWEMFN